MSSPTAPPSAVHRSPAGEGKTVLVVGVFDLFHRGHLELLKAARAHGERLIVIINGDEFTARYKRRPVIDEVDRAEIVASLRCVDAVEISNVNDVKPCIERHGVNVIVHGDDWPHEAYLQQIEVTEAYMQQRGIEMAYTPYYMGVSTSDLIQSIRRSGGST